MAERMTASLCSAPTKLLLAVSFREKLLSSATAKMTTSTGQVDPGMLKTAKLSQKLTGPTKNLGGFKQRSRLSPQLNA